MLQVIKNRVVWFYQRTSQQLTAGTCSTVFPDSAEHTEIVSYWSAPAKTTQPRCVLKARWKVFCDRFNVCTAGSRLFQVAGPFLAKLHHLAAAAAATVVVVVVVVVVAVVVVADK